MWYQHVMVTVVTALSCRVSRARRFEHDFAMRMVPLGEGQMKAADNRGRRTISAIQVCEVYVLQSLCCTALIKFRKGHTPIVMA